MSIISSKAEHVYKGNALLQEAYIAGATRQPTEEEIKAACLAIMPYVMAQPSRQVFDSLTKATGAYPGQEIVRKVIEMACEIGGIMSVSRESVHPDYIPEDFGELLRMAVDYVYEQGEHYSEDALLEAFKPAIDKHDRQVAERAFELGCVAVDAEEHGVGCRFTVGQLEELSRDYGRDAYSVNNPYGRGES